jgi:curli biogenesis system outer membrane secretion channel CsgG
MHKRSQLSHKSAVCALVLSFLVTGCVTTGVQVTRLVPGQVHLPGVKAIAVLPFQSRKAFEGKLAADKIEMELVNAGYFTVVERNQLNQVLQQLRLEQTGLFNEETGAQVGQLVKADAVVMGNLSRSEVRDSSDFVKTRKGGYQVYSRQAELAVDCKVVMLGTGTHATAFPVQKQIQDSQREPGALASAQSLIDACLSAMARDVLVRISPHKETLTVQFDSGGKELANVMKPGIELAKAQVADQAVDSFRTTASQHPGASSAHYNLGVSLFLTGQFDEAEKSVNQAIQLYPSSTQAKTTGASLATYSRMLSVIRTERENSKKLPPAEAAAK